MTSPGRELEDELRSRFEVREERFDHGPFTAELLLPRTPDALIDVSDFNTDERLPYWAELWPAAKAMTREILETSAIAGAVLEIGCGVGLPSIALGSRGIEVVASDYYADALLFTRTNALRNGISNLETREVDWRRIPVDLPTFPLVVAADVLYEARNVDSLASALPRLIKSGGQLWLADPGRVYFDPFLERCGALGYRIVPSVEREEVNAHHPERPTRVRIVQLTAP